MWDCHTTSPQRVDLAPDRRLRNWWLRTQSGSSHSQVHKTATPPWCAVPTRGVGGIVNFKAIFLRRAVKSIPFSRWSHRRNHLCRSSKISANLPTIVAARRQIAEPDPGSIVPHAVQTVSFCRSGIQSPGLARSPAT